MFCLYESRTSPPSRDLALQNYDRQAGFPLACKHYIDQAGTTTMQASKAKLCSARGRRRRPLFTISLWNVHGRVEQDIPRTNNSIEGWHDSFDLRVQCHHTPDDPSISREVGQGTSQQRTSPGASACPHSSAATKKEVPVGESETERHC